MARSKLKDNCVRESEHLSPDIIQLALTSAFDQMSGGMIVVNRNLHLIEANVAFCKLIGLSRADLLSIGIAEITSILADKIENIEELRTKMRLYAMEVEKSDTRLRADLLFSSPETRTVELQVWPMRDPRSDTGQIIGHVGAFRDVSDEREKSRELRIANVRLIERQSELDAALEEVNRLNAALEERVVARTMELRMAVEKLAALQEAALMIASVRSIAESLGQIADSVKRIFAADGVRLGTLHRDRSGELRVTSNLQMDDRGRPLLEPVDQSPSDVTQRIIKDREPWFIENVDAEGAPRSRMMGPEVMAYVGLPLVRADEILGILFATFNSPQAFPPEMRRYLEAFASQAAIAIANAQLFDELHRAATTDVLTELPNHRHILTRLDEELSRSNRTGRPLSIAMIDIDGFKRVNDTYGHLQGDEVLRLIANALRQALRLTDVIGRYGGDEFLTLLPDTSREESVVALQRFERAMESLWVDWRELRRAGAILNQKREDDEFIKAEWRALVNLSIGVAVYPTDTTSPRELIELADAEMYLAKRRHAGGDD